MIWILISWLFTFYITVSVGVAVDYLFNLFNKSDQPEITLFNGFSILSAILSCISIFYRINIEVILAITSLMLLSNILLRRQLIQYLAIFFISLKTGNFFTNSVKVIACISILILAVTAPSHGDSGFYHAQAIQWSEQYKAIPGLGNFFGRIAFNSSFFITQAFFSFNFYLKESLHLLNSFLILIVTLWIIRMVYENKSRNSVLLIFFSSLLLLIFLHFRGWVSSAAPDIPTAILIWVVIILYLLLIENKEQFSRYFIAITVLSFTAVTIKISAAFILLVPIYLLIKNLSKREWNNIYLFIGTGASILLPFLIRNYILSGYLIYPFPSIDIFNPDWKIPLEDVRLEKITIHAFTKIPDHNIHEVINLSFGKWFPIWFSNLGLHLKLIFVIILISPAFLLLQLYQNKNINRNWLALFLMLFASIVFWFTSAPDFRFGFGFIVPFLCLCSSLFLKKYLQVFVKYYMVTLFVFAVSVTLLTVHIIRKRNLTFSEIVIHPEDYPTVRTKTIYIDKVAIKIPASGNICWNTAIPCLMEVMYDPRTKLRKKSIDDGFYKEGNGQH